MLIGRFVSLETTPHSKAVAVRPGIQTTYNASEKQPALLKALCGVWLHSTCSSWLGSGVKSTPLPKRERPSKADLSENLKLIKPSMPCRSFAVSIRQELLSALLVGSDLAVKKAVFQGQGGESAGIFTVALRL
ncbi:MAG: hypothetical protein DWH78_09435 [Planctomycetota bacterium]|jgi:hypothetical protein|nr:MAG: hypothetical protein DWH78_09435 [Planctomycetota bacterium]